MSNLKFTLSDATLFLPVNLSGLLEKLYSGLLVIFEINLRLRDRNIFYMAITRDYEPFQFFSC